MKILMVVALFMPVHRGGAEMQCWKQAKALAQRGHKVTVLTPWWSLSSKRSEWVDGVRIRRMGFLLPLTWLARRWHARLKPPPAEGGGEVVSATPKARKKRFRWMSLTERPGLFSFILEVACAIRFRRLRPDVIHVHESHWIAGFAHWMAERLDVPVFCKEGLLPVLDFGGAQHVPWRERWRERRTKCRFIAMTDAIQDALIKAGIAPDQIACVPNGVEIPERKAQPQLYGDALYVGNLSQGAAHKGFDVLLKAMGEVVKEAPEIKLRICGAGVATGWQAMADELGCGTAVEFVGRVEDLTEYHHHSGFLVLPSRKEGISNALLEAQAAGLPAIVTDIPGNTAVIQHGFNGLVVPVGDAVALARAIVEMHRSTELRERLGHAARQQAEARFAISRVAEQLEELYHTALVATTPDGFQD